MHLPLPRPLHLLVLLFAALLAAPGVSTPARAESASEHYAHRHRALDTTERARALEIATGPAQSELQRRANAAGGAPARLETIDVDLHRAPKDESPADYRRRADVYVYDYATDQLAWTVVDLDSCKVESVTVTPSVQRPLSDREVAHALDLLFADPASAARIRAEFESTSGRPLRDQSELVVSGLVYRADSMPDANTTESAACGRHRCAQLLISTQDNFALEIPIVDLSKERVVQTRYFGSPPATGAPKAGAH